jgi:hypothetical protein
MRVLQVEIREGVAPFSNEQGPDRQVIALFGLVTSLVESGYLKMCPAIVPRDNSYLIGEMILTPSERR